MISANGRYVAYSSVINHVIDGHQYSQWDVFVYDRQTEATEQVSVASDGTPGNNNSGIADTLFGSGRASISADGRSVAFTSYASNLVPGDTNGLPDLFVRDRQTGVTERVSVASDGTQANGYSIDASLSGDARFVAFTSPASNLVAGDTNAAHDVFVRDRQTGEITRVSVGAGGTQANGISIGPSLSADGRYVCFTSAAHNLVAGDTNGYADVFVYDAQTGGTMRVSIAADGTQGNHQSGANIGGVGTGGTSISADGRHVAFLSLATNLVPGDTLTTRKLFLATLNDAPTARDDAASTPQDTPVTVNVLANDSDPENDPLTVLSVTPPGHGAAVVNADNTVTYTPAGGFSGGDSFTYTIRDAAGNTATATVSVTVVAAPPPPPPGGLIPDPIDPTKTALVITGTEGNDVIVVLAGATPGTLAISVNGATTSAPAPTGHVIVYGLGGNDVLVAVTLPTAAILDGGAGDDTLMEAGAGSGILLGGPGNDALFAGSGNCVLVGGDGNDALFATRGGSNILIGGRGGDTIFGGFGGDLLIGGWTAHDANLSALAALSAEWSSGRSYEDRVANLRGTGTGPRLNGTFFLTGEGAGATVFADGAANSLSGGGDRDWFFADVIDLLLDRTGDEFIDPPHS